jgi:hypothetical protein
VIATQAGALPQVLDFIDETLLEHGVETPLDTLMQYMAIVRRQHKAQRFQPRQAIARVMGAWSLPGQAQDFKGALDTLDVGRANRSRRRGVVATEFSMQGLPTKAFGLGRDFGAQGRIGRRHRIESVEQRPVVEHRSADQHGPAAVGMNAADLGGAIGRELGRRIGLLGIANIDQRMWVTLERVRIGLGRADIQPR